MTTATTTRRPAAIPRAAVDQLMAIYRHYNRYPGYDVVDALTDAYRLGRAHGIAEDSRYGQYVPGPGGRPWSGVRDDRDQPPPTTAAARADGILCTCGTLLDIRPRWGNIEAGAWLWIHADGSQATDHTPLPAAGQALVVPDAF